MQSLRKLQERIAYGVLLVAPIVMLWAGLQRGGAPTFIDRAAMHVVAPLQGIAAAVSDSLGGAWSRYIALYDARIEAEARRIENAHLKAEIALLRRAAADADRMRRLAGFREGRLERLVPASVISRETTATLRVVRITIDRGEADLRPGMAVVAPEGLIGQIEKVYPGRADVLLTIDPRAAVDVLVRRTRVGGTLRGTGDEERYTCRVDFIGRREGVAVGDEVVTSGLGGSFPKGIPVGRVSLVTSRPDQLFLDVVVDPAVDFSTIEDVYVVVGESASPGLFAGEARTPADVAKR